VKKNLGEGGRLLGFSLIFQMPPRGRGLSTVDASPDEDSDSQVCIGAYLHQ
jgi:hypothetical protein